EHRDEEVVYFGACPFRPIREPTDQNSLSNDCRKDDDDPNAERDEHLRWRIAVPAGDVREEVAKLCSSWMHFCPELAAATLSLAPPHCKRRSCRRPIPPRLPRQNVRG